MVEVVLHDKRRQKVDNFIQWKLSDTCVLGAIFGLGFPETVPISWSGTAHRFVPNDIPKVVY